MTYTQMLFALMFDKLIFGHTPGVMSILGSSLILGSAITIAMQQDPNRSQKANETGRPSESQSDEESRTGLLGGMQDVETSEDHDRIPLREVQVRALR